MEEYDAWATRNISTFQQLLEEPLAHHDMAGAMPPAGMRVGHVIRAQPRLRCVLFEAPQASRGGGAIKISNEPSGVAPRKGSAGYGNPHTEGVR